MIHLGALLAGAASTVLSDDTTFTFIHSLGAAATATYSAGGGYWTEINSILTLN